MIIYGHRLFGKVDVVPGLGHVATRFFHIDYVPLVPTACWLVTEQSGNGWRGVKIPWSAKSIFVAWGRAICLAVGIGTAIAAVAMALDGRHGSSAWVGPAVVSAVAWGGFVLSKKHRLFTRASYARACQLAEALKVDDAGMAALSAAYGQPPRRGFQPVIPPVAVAPLEVPAAVEIIEDTHPPEAAAEPSPPPPTAVTAQRPLRGY